MNRICLIGINLLFLSFVRADVIQEWDFAESNWHDTRINDRVSNHVGRSTAVPAFENGTLLLDGKCFINVPAVSAKDLPTKALTVSARVSLTKGQRWGNIVGFLQDNGAYERGWSLGYNESKYVFWISTGGKLRQVESKRPFRPGTWDDVTGVFDGREIRLYVNGVLSGQAVTPGEIAYPEQARYTIAAYQDDNELYPMVGKIDSVVLHDSPLTEATIRKAAGLPVPLEFSIRPSLQFLSPGMAKVNWAVEDDTTPGQLEYGDTEELGTVLSAENREGEREVRLQNLEPHRIYYYQIRHAGRDGKQSSPVFQFSTALNFSPPVPTKEGPTKRGFAVVLGADLDVIERLAAHSEMTVLVFESDLNRARETREKLYRIGLYGSRVTIYQVDDFEDLPITSCMADLVECPVWRDEFSPSEIVRILAPGRGSCSIPRNSAISEKEMERLRKSGFELSLNRRSMDFYRPLPENSGQWTHQYGDPGNTVTSGESLSGATGTGDFTVQWFGRPGADFGLDRQSRMPAPLAVHSRLFHQGMNRFVALNSANGAYLWSLEIPEFQRLNMPRDASNWCADEYHLLVAVDERAWILDAETGRRRAALKPISKQGKRNWGYIAISENRLVGSTTKPQSDYTAYWTGKMWFDGKAGSYGTAQVCSDDLFAYNYQDLKPAWHYHNGLILNPTISICEGKIYFVETRNPIANASITSQVSGPELWKDQFLVCLDLESGRKQWEQAIDTEDGTITFYMQVTSDAILLTASNTAYHLYAFEPGDGRPMWKRSTPWPNDHHSGHIQHPVIVDGTIYLQPNGYDLRTGEILTSKVGARSGCPTYIGSDKALIYRGAGRRVAMWDRETETVTAWDRLRPSCWLSLIPANGMLLVPEGGGGCSCGGWMETSIGFAPYELLQSGGAK